MQHGSSWRCCSTCLAAPRWRGGRDRRDRIASRAGPPSSSAVVHPCRLSVVMGGGGRRAHGERAEGVPRGRNLRPDRYSRLGRLSSNAD